MIETMTPSRRGRARVKTSMTDRVRQFIENNPSEELTYADMRVKFDLTKTQAWRVVANLLKEGVVEAVTVVRNRAKGRSE